METQRPKVNDIVRIYCGDEDLPRYYGYVAQVKDSGVEVDTFSSIGKAFFRFDAYRIVVAGHRETRIPQQGFIINVESEVQ